MVSIEVRRKKFTQRKIAAALQVDPSSVSVLLSGGRRLQIAEAEILAKMLGEPVGEILRHAGIDPGAGEAGSVPIIGRIDDENVIHFKKPVNGPRTVEAPPGAPADCVAARYETMGALGSRDGWVVFFVPGGGVDIESIGG